MKNRRDFLGIATVGVVAASDLLAQAQAQTPGASGSAPSGIAPTGPSNEHTDFVLSTTADPQQLFDQWFKEAKDGGDANANAMTLATVDALGMPDARVMLLKEVRDGSFLFTTFEHSVKGKELKANAKAALLFYWAKLGRQARVRGNVRQLTAAEAETAWLKRGPRAYKLRDWAYRQSEVFQTAEEIEARLAEADRRFPGDVPRGNWTGYLVTPVSLEFFYPHPKTGLHERIRFRRRNPAQPWIAERLGP